MQKFGKPRVIVLWKEEEKDSTIYMDRKLQVVLEIVHL